MCLLFVAWRHHPRYPLLVAANRDEFHARATASLARWPDAPLVAGRDLEAGGTWFGVGRGGRFSALTNFRDGVPRAPGLRSRGELVAGFLHGSEASARDWCERALARGDEYGGFNLFAGDGVHDGAGLVWCSNREPAACVLAPGVYGLSNHLLDTPWPKVERGRHRFVELLRAPEPDEQALFDMLADRDLPADGELPDTGVGRARERQLAPLFIVDEAYGTRASTLLFMAVDGGGRIIERSFDACGEACGEQRVALPVE